MKTGVDGEEGGDLGSGCLALFHRDKATIETGNRLVNQRAVDDDLVTKLREASATSWTPRISHRRQ